MTYSLYPDWTGNKVKMPSWFIRSGLQKKTPIVRRLYASASKWEQAERDGLHSLAPIIVAFNKEPREIKKIVGGVYWREIRQSKTKSNVDRLTLMMLGGWSIDEAMTFPAKTRKHAKSFLHVGKSTLLMACKLSEKHGDLSEQLIIARDVQRMGGKICPEWGRKRLKREHDSLIVKKIMDNSDPTPWSKPWFFECNGYTFSLLKSESELVLEGALQRHCSRSYAAMCRSGKEFVFSIQGRERATCSWGRGESGIQVKGFANTAVSEDCVNASIAARKEFSSRRKS